MSVTRTAVLAALVLLAGPSALADTEADAPDTDQSLETHAPGSGTDTEVTNMVGEALRKLAMERNRDGLKHLAAKDYPRALERFQQAYELDPLDAEIANNLGYIYQLLGNAEEAELHFRAALAVDPERLVTYLNLADLLSVKGETLPRLAEAAELLSRARELKGNKARIILRQARVSALRGDFTTAERFYLDLGSTKGTSAKTFLEIGDFYRDFGYADRALAWYRQVEDEELGKLAATRIFELEAEKEARKLGWNQRVEIVSSRARALATRGRLAMSRGDMEEAERLLQDALGHAPSFAAARADLGELYAKTEREEQAELELLRALAADPGNPEIAARLGELYVRAGRGAEAAPLLTRALEARPEWHALHLTLAKALRVAGDLRGALSRVDRYLSIAAEGEQQREALALKTAIAKLMPGPQGEAGIAQSLATMEKARTLDPDIARALGKVKLHLAEDRPEAAMAELRLLPEAKRGKDVLNLEGKILISGGRMAEAASTLLESLSADPNQAEVHEQLGSIFDSLGNSAAAVQHFERAESLGSLPASYHLARLAWDNGDEKPWRWVRDLGRVSTLYRARQRASTFLRSDTASLYASDARALEARIEQSLHGILAIWMSVLAAVAALVILVLWRLFGGASLADLVTRHPEAGPEVLRTMAAIRHEVLKHNTIMLGGLADAVERRDRDLPDKAAHFASVLWGARGGDGGAAGRLDNYVRQLVKIGRSHGVRLNLTHKDPALSALCAGFDALERTRPLLARADRLGQTSRGQLLRRLKVAFDLLNVRGYEAVRVLLDTLRVLRVDKAMLERTFERVRREPGFTGQDIAPLQLDDVSALPQGVLLARRDFEDIMVNLLRNALQSSLRESHRPAEVGLSVHTHASPITGLESIVFSVHDRSKEALTTEMIRGRYIEQGLGLTADLVSRYEGSVDVIPGEGRWTKSVRVTLPLAPSTAELSTAHDKEPLP